MFGIIILISYILSTIGVVWWAISDNRTQKLSECARDKELKNSLRILLSNTGTDNTHINAEKEAEEWRAKVAERERLYKEEQERARKEKEERMRETPGLYFQECLENELGSTIFNDVLYEDYEADVAVKIELLNRILSIEATLPNKDEIGVLGYNQRTDEPLSWKNRGLATKYENALYAICLRSIKYLCSQDELNQFDGVLYNGYVEDYSPITGQLQNNLIISLYTTKEQFSGIDPLHIDPKACFKALKGVSAAKLIDLTPINPVLVLDKNDHRFIENKEVSTSSGTNLASMDWKDFEQLVRQILALEFGKSGEDVKVTQASRDGGVDAVVFDPDPLRGGKIIIQAKRYTNTVSVSAVRDLYGTVINEGANSGILITTSDYGHDSYEFAKGKPIKLLNGGHLLALLQKNGQEGYINLQEAKNILNNAEIQDTI